MKIIDNEYDRTDLENAGLVGRMKLMKVTPELAEKWCSKLSKNERPLSEDHVDRFCEIIRAGLWVPASSIFHLSKDEHLLNAQHRCRAIIKTGITVYAWVCFDLDEKVYLSIDTEIKKRNLGNLLPPGTASRNNISAITNAIWVSRHGEWPKVAREALDLYYEFQPDIEWAWRAFGQKVSVFGGAVMGAFAYAHAVGKLEKKVEQFAEECMGVGRPSTDCISAQFETYCMNAPKGGGNATKKRLRKAFRAIQLYYQGAQQEKLVDTREGHEWAREMHAESPMPEDAAMVKASPKRKRHKKSKRGNRVAKTEMMAQA